MKTRRRPIRVRLMTLLTALLAILAVGILVTNSQKRDIAQLQQLAQETRYEQVNVENERSQLQYELSIADSSDYIADKARALYGYLVPGEIRFKVTNPEALYGQQPVASVVEETK